MPQCARRIRPSHLVICSGAQKLHRESGYHRLAPGGRRVVTVGNWPQPLNTITRDHQLLSQLQDGAIGHAAFALPNGSQNVGLGEKKE